MEQKKVWPRLFFNLKLIHLKKSRAFLAFGDHVRVKSVLKFCYSDFCFMENRWEKLRAHELSKIAQSSKVDSIGFYGMQKSIVYHPV